MSWSSLIDDGQNLTIHFIDFYLLFKHKIPED